MSPTASQPFLISGTCLQPPPLGLTPSHTEKLKPRSHKRLLFSFGPGAPLRLLNAQPPWPAVPLRPAAAPVLSDRRDSDACEPVSLLVGDWHPTIEGSVGKKPCHRMRTAYLQHRQRAVLQLHAQAGVWQTSVPGAFPKSRNGTYAEIPAPSPADLGSITSISGAVIGDLAKGAANCLSLRTLLAVSGGRTLQGMTKST